MTDGVAYLKAAREVVEAATALSKANAAILTDLLFQQTVKAVGSRESNAQRAELLAKIAKAKQAAAHVMALTQHLPA